MIPPPRPGDMGVLPLALQLGLSAIAELLVVVRKSIVVGSVR